MEQVYLAIVLAPLIAAIVVGLGGSRMDRAWAHRLTIVGVGASFALSLVVAWDVFVRGAPVFDGAVYTWLVSDGLRLEIGFLIDSLSAVMMTVVTFVSLMVHIYTIGYMKDDPGYARFFSYISLFTFGMLMLVMANNFLQLFFGWEAVGLVSYLLIGFWFKRPTAVAANLKAFLVNRVGDLGLLLGIAAIFMYTGSLAYSEVFAAAPTLVGQTINVIGDYQWQVATLICILLFIGAMGKSAQVPLHVWLPDSMEGPTPISALIHAATMVTAGIFLVARTSPLFELSVTALSFVLVIGAVTALFMGLLGLVQNDIKRVVAYSTLSQLGYMTVALGVSAYAAGIFHLFTHAFFKALLFLAAGSVIIAMHHVQDMRQMGGLRKYMPITYWTSLIGALALIGFPGMAGFYSKDAIIEVVGLAEMPGATFAWWAVMLGVFITALYTFRMFFMVFHGQPRMDEHTREHLQESPRVVTLPLVFLAIPSVVIGALMLAPMLFGGVFDDAIHVLPERDVLGMLAAQGYTDAWSFLIHGLQAPAVWLAAAGVLAAWVLYIWQPHLPGVFARVLAPVFVVLDRKYWFDELYLKGFAPLGRGLGRLFWQVGDVRVIDGWLVNGSARAVGRLAVVARRAQTGFLYHYALVMITALALLMGWLLFVR